MQHIWFLIETCDDGMLTKESKERVNKTKERQKERKKERKKDQ
jgi:hypothetical protein